MGLVQKIVEYLAAIDDGEASVAELHVACILPRDRKGSHDDGFNVRLHHPLPARLLGDSTQFIQLEAFATPRVRQRFERYVEFDLVPQSEAVRNRASEAADPNLLPLSAILFDAQIEHGRGDGDYSERRCRIRATRFPRRTAIQTSAGSGVPMSWNRRAKIDQAGHRRRNDRSGNGKVVVLGRRIDRGRR